MNILATTLGASWPVVPELLAFTNPEQVPLLRDHPSANLHQQWRDDWDIQAVEEVWVATTKGTQVRTSIETLQDWFAQLPHAPRLRVFTMDGVAELASIQECRHMQELIFRVVLHSRARSSDTGGKLYLSLVGGRKTISADHKLAAEHFGCDLLLHIVDTGEIPNVLRNPPADQLLGPLDPATASCLSPIIVRGAMPARTLFQLPQARIERDDFPIPYSPKGGSLHPSTELAKKVDGLLQQASHLLLNFTTRLLKSSPQSNFHALYSLPPSVIEKLRNSIVGRDQSQNQSDLEWVRSIPKSELHCHLGGILDASEILDIAALHLHEIETLAQNDASFSAWLSKVRAASSSSIESIHSDLTPRGWKDDRDNWGKKNRHIATSAFVLHALASPKRIDTYQFGDLLNPERFQAVEIGPYEKLGDLQGSSLLQTEKALRFVCQRIIEKCQVESATYCEIRCSPLNCIHGGLSPFEVIAILRDALGSSPSTRFKLIFIASRHGQDDNVTGHVNLGLQWLKNDFASFSHWFAGFDLAGAEHKRSPKEVQKLFRPALQSCLNITIHAGENEPAQNIWEAVYDLNADRIGHGLTLQDQPELLQRLRLRRVALEMCPSSNYQIVGYHDRAIPSSKSFPQYPLIDYMNQGLKVTLNTDDPGMSRTTLSREYLKAAWMCPDGLSRWQILQLVRNGFKAAFLDPSERQDLILKAEKTLLNNLST